MVRQAYKRFRFADKSLDLIKTMNEIIDEYVAQGFTLTVRQLYYQLVARDVIENNDLSYKRTTSLVNDARLAGLIDWEAIEDRARFFSRQQRWKSGRQILEAAAESYHMDMWYNQTTRPYVIIEKDALKGVLEPTCFKWDVPLLAARGYPSVSVLHEFVQDDVLPVIQDQRILVIHLGDHDPSGIDMTRDLRERIQLFVGGAGYVDLERISLNMDQIRKFKPPFNPAKTTDSRFTDYEKLYGKKSWELDAMSPVFLAEIVEKKISEYHDPNKWKERVEHINAVKTKLTKIAKRFKVSGTPGLPGRK